MDKHELRIELEAKRYALSESDHQTMSELAFLQLKSMPWVREAKKILIFISYKNEIDTHRILKYLLACEKQVYVPKVDMATKKMIAVEINSLADLSPGAYGILEPKLDKTTPESFPAIDFVLTPGLAFDKEGYRVGYGGGYYDKFFSQLPRYTKKIGYGFDFQIVEHVPHEFHDYPVDAIVTNQRIIYCQA